MGFEIWFSGGGYVSSEWSWKGGMLATILILSFIILYFLIYLIFRKKKKFEKDHSRKMARRYLLYSILLFCIVCIIGELIIENI